MMICSKHGAKYVESGACPVCKEELDAAPEERLTDAELSAQYGVEPPKDTGDFLRWQHDIGVAAAEQLNLAAQTKILERVPGVLEAIRNRPFYVGLTHAKILALALKIEQERTAEAVRIGLKMAEAQRVNAVKAFDEVFEDDPTDPYISLDRDKARATFLEKLGMKEPT